MNLLKSPIRKNVGANIFGVVIQFISQIALVPLFLRFWNVDLYSDWIVISALSSFFTMTDLGLGSVTANQFVMAFSQQDTSKCNKLLTNNIIMTVTIAIAVMLGCYLFVNVFNIVDVLKINVLSRHSANYVFLMQILLIFIGMIGMIWDAVFRAVSWNYKAAFISNIARLLECIVIIVSLCLHFSIELMVTLYILPKSIVCIYKWLYSKKIFKYKFNCSYYDWCELKKIFIPSVSFMAFPIGNAIVLQGMTLVVNRFFGPSAVVSFNTTRTMCNFLKTLLTTIQQAVWPEYTIAYAQGNIDRMRILHRKVFSLTTIAAIFISIFLMLFGKYIYNIWTQGDVQFDSALMFAFLLVLLMNNLWESSSVSLMATNKHTRIGIMYVVLAFVSLLLAMCLGYFLDTLPLMVLSLLLIHIPLSYYAIKQAINMTHDSIRGLLSSFYNYKIWRK